MLTKIYYKNDQVIGWYEQFPGAKDIFLNRDFDGFFEVESPAEGFRLEVVNVSTQEVRYINIAEEIAAYEASKAQNTGEAEQP